MRNIFLIPIFLLSFTLSAQIHDTIRAKYFVLHEHVGKLDRKFERSLKKMDLVHPSKYLELSLEQSNAANYNEGAVAFYLGMMKYMIYNQTDPEYDPSNNAVEFSELLSNAFRPISDFLGSNLDNHAFVLKKAIGLQASDKKYFFDVETSEEASSQIIKSLTEYQKELEFSPDTFIATHENLTLYDVDMEEMYEDIPLEGEEISEPEIVDQKEGPKRKQSADYPSAFIEMDRKYIIKGEPTLVRAVAHGYNDTYLECSNGKIFPKANPMHYELIADSVGTCQVTIYGVGATRRAALAMYSYQVIEKPDVFLYIGNTVSGKKISEDNYELTCDELRYFRFEGYTSEYVIQSWEMKINGAVFNENGSTLSQAAINAIEKANSDDAILLKAKVQTPTNEILSVKGIFLR